MKEFILAKKQGSAKQVLISKSPQKTIEFALEFAQKLKGGEILALSGELGSGKTTFIKGLAEGLKVSEVVTSPTFVMLKVYPGRIDKREIELVHVDAYRAETIEDIKSVGIEDYFNRKDIIMAIEWAEKIKEILPKDSIKIEFKHLNNNQRKITYDFNH